jgi:hypothetical protein
MIIPSVLTDEEIRTVREHTETYMKNTESLPEHHRAPIGTRFDGFKTVCFARQCPRGVEVSSLDLGGLKGD